MTKLTKENIEMHIMLYVDNELPAGEVRDLLAFLELYPEYKAMLSDYQYSVLPPEEIVFDCKEQLVQSQGRKVFPLKMTIGIAAAIAVIFAVAGYYQWARKGSIWNNSQHDIVVHSTASPRSKPEAAADLNKSDEKREMPHNVQPAKGAVVAQNVVASHVPDRKKKDLRIMAPMNRLPMAGLALGQQPVTIFAEPVNTNSEQKEQAVTAEPVTEPQPKDLLAMQLAAVYEQSDRLKGVHSLVAALDESKNKAVDAWQQIKSANVILKIGSKEIVIK